MRIAIGIATRGRAAMLAETLRELRRQLRPPDRLLVCHTVPDDIAGAAAAAPVAEFIASPPGLPRQRNAILDAAAEDGSDAVLFLDDDFLPAPDYLAVTEAVLEARPDCVVTTGTVLADGAKGPGIRPEEGREILARDRPPGDPLAAQAHFNGYGCNMAVRMAPVLAHGLRFDEALPLYAWYEDIDFTRALGRHGAILRLEGARGRASRREVGAHAGPSGSATARWSTRSTWRARAPSPGPRHPERGAPHRHEPRPQPLARAGGGPLGAVPRNMIGLWDLVRGRAAPSRILSL
jgi:hypothetical protein